MLINSRQDLAWRHDELDGPNLYLGAQELVLDFYCSYCFLCLADPFLYSLCFHYLVSKVDLIWWTETIPNYLIYSVAFQPMQVYYPIATNPSNCWSCYQPLLSPMECEHRFLLHEIQSEGLLPFLLHGVVFGRHQHRHCRSRGTVCFQYHSHHHFLFLRLFLCFLHPVETMMAHHFSSYLLLSIF